MAGPLKKEPFFAASLTSHGAAFNEKPSNKNRTRLKTFSVLFETNPVLKCYQGIKMLRNFLFNNNSLIYQIEKNINNSHNTSNVTNSSRNRVSQKFSVPFGLITKNFLQICLGYNMTNGHFRYYVLFPASGIFQATQDSFFGQKHWFVRKKRSSGNPDRTNILYKLDQNDSNIFFSVKDALNTTQLLDILNTNTYGKYFRFVFFVFKRYLFLTNLLQMHFSVNPHTGVLLLMKLFPFQIRGGTASI